ncbi:hypothetical protein NCC49_006605 [Naganishia albida]|nr:hypothetical protein NCC49_006605 [Naganishia albida]
MLDSGATGNFINQNVVDQYAIPTDRLKNPKALSVVDGRPIDSGRVTHRTSQTQMTMDGHQEQVSFLATAIGKHQVILGLPWLERHNPVVNWVRRQVTWPQSDPESATTAEDTLECDSVEIHSISMDELRETDSEDIDVCLLLQVTVATSSTLHIAALSADDGDNTTSIPPEFTEFADVFSKKNADILPEHTKYDHHIDIEPGKTPSFGRLYNLCETELAAVEKYIRENLSRGFIRASTSPAGAPVLFVKKKDGTLRLCVDYRKLNAITVKNRYPLPLIDESLDRLRTATWFTKIDLRGAYNLIRITEGDEWKTAFRTRYGLFEYLVMPFGLTNAPATFQHMINEVLREHLDVCVVVYLDDILVFSKTRDQHVQDVKAILSKLRANRLWAKLEKCEFFKHTVEFLGYVISPEGTSMDPGKIQAVVEWPVPKTVRDVRAFLGFANFYRKFIHQYSRVVGPLVQLTKQTTPWEWTEERQKAFESLKNAFTTAPILTHYDPNRKIIIETDASDYAVAGILSHPDVEGRLQPVAFYSRKLDVPERNYAIYDKELLAIVEAFRHWRAYTEGAQDKITVYSDHRNLVYFSSAQVLSRRQARWSESLSNLDFEILHRPGALMGKADALTRRHDFRDGSKAKEHEPRLLFRPNQLVIAAAIADLTEHDGDDEEDISLTEKLIIAQHEDPDCVDRLASAPKFPLANSEGDSERDGLLIHKRRIVVPNENSAVKLDVVESLHDGKLNGHPGQAKTLAAVGRHYVWDNMREFVNTYVRGCHTCRRDKPARHKRYGNLQPLPIPDNPWQSISMDAIVKLPSSGGYDSILTIVDRFSKIAHFIPFTESGFDATALADMFKHHIIRIHGVPTDIVSDRGSTFNSKFWKALMDGLGTKCNLSTAFHPQSDGQTERVNQCIEQYLRICCNEAQDDWSHMLDEAEFQYNSQQHASTGFSPFEVVYGTQPNHPTVSFPSPNPAAGELLVEMVRIRDAAKINIKKAQEAAAEYYDRNSTDPPEFDVRDQVWVNMKNWKPKRPSKKLDHKFAGPFKVVEKLSPLVYRLDLPPTLSVHPTLPVALLEPYTAGHEGQRQPKPPRIMVDQHEECVPERILDSRETEGRFEFLVKWEGQEDEENTWETFENLQHLRILGKFQKERPDKPFPTSRPFRPKKRVTPQQ